MVAVFRKLFWTEHSKIKMRQYGLSAQKVLGILRKPERKEKGIASGTTAVMRTNKKFVNKTKPLPKIGRQKPKAAAGEIWLMYKDVTLRRDSGQEKQRKIISAWRYPGVSRPGEPIPIPDDIKQELSNNDEYK